MFNRKKIEKLEDKLASQMLENVMLSIQSGFFQNRLKDARSKLAETQLELESTKAKYESMRMAKDDIPPYPKTNGGLVEQIAANNYFNERISELNKEVREAKADCIRLGMEKSELKKDLSEMEKIVKEYRERSKGVDYIGKINLLHRHPEMEGRMGLDPDHVIVDRKDWDLVIAMFESHNHNVKTK